jgi:arginine:ornithine antiporter/lysine permease
MTTVLIQIMLFVTLASEDAFNFMLNMTSALSLIPFVLAAGYALRIASTGDGYAPGERRTREAVIAAVATLYTVFLLFAAGPSYMLVSLVIYAPGTVLFVMARREQGRQLFDRTELVILVLSVIGAAVGVVGLATGAITI